MGCGEGVNVNSDEDEESIGLGEHTELYKSLIRTRAPNGFVYFGEGTAR